MAMSNFGRRCGSDSLRGRLRVAVRDWAVRIPCWEVRFPEWGVRVRGTVSHYVYSNALVQSGPKHRNWYFKKLCHRLLDPWLLNLQAR